jgi:hypothetical protein
MRNLKRKFLLGGLLAAVFLAVAAPAMALHSWGGYHWARTTDSFTLQLGDNVSGSWDSYLGVASTDWSVSIVLDTTVVPGGTNPRTCKPTSGRVEVCNAAYGYNGWLGIAQIWISGSHITQGTVKANDSYFNTATYNKPAWRQMVMCQEIGHTFGLDHQDTNFNNPNLGTCMDYTSDPSTNQHPNQHDYDELVTIYTHLESTTTVGSTLPPKNNVDVGEPGEWGREVARSADGRVSEYERDLGGGNKVITHVIWAEPGLGRNR